MYNGGVSLADETRQYLFPPTVLLDGTGRERITTTMFGELFRPMLHILTW